jgi:hypothetical protein
VSVFLLGLGIGACSGRSTRGDEASGGPKGGDAGENATGGAAPSGGASGTSAGGTASGGEAGEGSATGGASGAGAGVSGAGGSIISGAGVGGYAGVGATPAGAGAGGAPQCEGPNPAGCSLGRGVACSAGRTCVLRGDRDAGGPCFSSRCLCGENGQWGCFQDCVEGECVDEAPCTTPNPAGCESDADCEAGMSCEPPVDAVCIPVGCACDEAVDTWSCRENCGGGECVPTCPVDCTPEQGGLCGDDLVTWVCTGSEIPVDVFTRAGCDDPGTQVPRFCCHPTFKAECQ